MLNLDALNKQLEATKPTSSGSSEELKKWMITSLKEGSEITFSLVESHAHIVDEGSPFVSVVEYSLKSKKSSFGFTKILPKSSFDETLTDPVAQFLQKLKDMYAKKNDGDNRIPKELYKTLMPKLYWYVPVVIKQRENEGVKWLRLSPSTFESLKDMISKWYNFEEGKGADFELKRADKTTYRVSPTPGNTMRAIDVIDNGILKESLSNLPALETLLYINNDEQVQAALEENLTLILAEVGDESEMDYGASQESSKPSAQPTQEEKSNIDEKMKNLFG